MDTELHYVCIIFLSSIILILLMRCMNKEKIEKFGNNNYKYIKINTYHNRNEQIYKISKKNNNNYCNIKYYKDIIKNGLICTLNHNDINIKDIGDGKTRLILDGINTEIEFRNKERFIKIIINNYDEVFYFTKNSRSNNINIINNDYDEIGYIDKNNRQADILLITLNEYNKYLEIFGIAYIISLVDG